MTSIQNSNLLVNHSTFQLNEAIKADEAKESSPQVTQTQIESFDENKDGKISYSEFKKGLQSQGVTTNDIAKLWNNYSNKAKQVEDVSLQKGNNTIYNVQQKSDGIYVRTSSDSSVADTKAVKLTSTDKSAAGNINVLTAGGKMSAVQSKENNINISGIMYSSDNKITSITIGNTEYSGSSIVGDESNPGTFTINNGSTKVATVTVNSNGHITSIKTNYSADNNQFTELTFNSTGKPTAVKEHSISNDKDTVITKSAASNTSSVSVDNQKVGQTVKTLANNAENLDFSRIDFRDVLEGLSDGALSAGDGITDSLTSELLSQLTKGNISDINKFVDDYITTYSQYADRKDDITNVLNNLKGGNSKLELKDVGNALVAFTLLSPNNQNFDSSNHSSANLKGLMTTLENNTGNYAAIIDHTTKLNSNITSEQAMSILAKVEVSENGSGNGTLDAGEIKEVAKQSLTGLVTSLSDRPSQIATITSEEAQKIVDNAQANFDQLVDLYNTTDTKLSTSDKQNLLVSLSNELYSNGNDGQMTFTQMETWVDSLSDNMFDSSKKTAIKTILRNMGKQTSNSTDKWISAKDLGRASSALALLNLTNNSKNVTKANMDSITQILRANSNINTIISKIQQQFPDLSSGDIRNIINASDKTNGTNYTDNDKKEAGNNVLDAATIVKNAKDNFGKLLDILDGDASGNLISSVKNNFIKELNARLSKSNITDTNAWLNSFCNAYNITDNAVKTKLENILNKLQASDTGTARKQLSLQDIGRFTTAFALVQGEDVTADNILRIAKNVNSTTLASTAANNGCKLSAETINAVVKAAEQTTSTTAATANQKIDSTEAKTIGADTLSGLASGTSKIADSTVLTKLSSTKSSDRKEVFNDMIKAYQNAYCTSDDTKTAKLPDDLFEKIAENIPKNGNFISISTFISRCYPNETETVKNAIRQVFNGLNEHNGNIRLMDIGKSMTSFALLKSEGIELSKSNLDKAQGAINGKTTLNQIKNAFSSSFGIDKNSTQTAFTQLSITDWGSDQSDIGKRFLGI